MQWQYCQTETLLHCFIQNHMLHRLGRRKGHESTFVILSVTCICHVIVDLEMIHVWHIWTRAFPKFDLQATYKLRRLLHELNQHYCSLDVVIVMVLLTNHYAVSSWMAVCSFLVGQAPAWKSSQCKQYLHVTQFHQTQEKSWLSMTVIYDACKPFRQNHSTNSQANMAMANPSWRQSVCSPSSHPASLCGP